MKAGKELAARRRGRAKGKKEQTRRVLKEGRMRQHGSPSRPMMRRPEPKPSFEQACREFMGQQEEG